MWSNPILTTSNNPFSSSGPIYNLFLILTTQSTGSNPLFHLKKQTITGTVVSSLDGFIIPALVANCRCVCYICSVWSLPGAAGRHWVFWTPEPPSLGPWGASWSRAWHSASPGWSHWRENTTGKKKSLKSNKRDRSSSAPGGGGGCSDLRQRVLRGCPVFRPVARYSKSSVNSWFSPNSTTSLKCLTCWTTVYSCKTQNMCQEIQFLTPLHTFSFRGCCRFSLKIQWRLISLYLVR